MKVEYKDGYGNDTIKKHINTKLDKKKKLNLSEYLEQHREERYRKHHEFQEKMNDFVRNGIISSGFLNVIGGGAAAVTSLTISPAIFFTGVAIASTGFAVAALSKISAKIENNKFENSEIMFKQKPVTELDSVLKTYVSKHKEKLGDRAFNSWVENICDNGNKSLVAAFRSVSTAFEDAYSSIEQKNTNNFRQTNKLKN